MDNLATYAKSFFLLYEQAHAKMDSVRARLFWEGFGEKKKYHMVRWDTLCKPKDFGGLGFVDSRVRNICLMSKWIYKLESGSEDLSCQILRNKYLRGAGFYQSSEVGGSQFWKSLHKIKKWVRMGLVYRVGNGRKCFFWHDVWLGDCPLKIQFPVLFSCCGQPDGTVAEVFDGQRWVLSFNRSLDHMGVAEWQAMNILLSGVVISDQEDMVSWSLENKGTFTAKSLYRFILNPGVIDSEMMEVWKTKCPLKQKNFCGCVLGVRFSRPLSWYSKVGLGLLIV
jgi:hypothetical protein